MSAFLDTKFDIIFSAVVGNLFQCSWWSCMFGTESLLKMINVSMEQCWSWTATLFFLSSLVCCDFEHSVWPYYCNLTSLSVAPDLFCPGKTCGDDEFCGETDAGTRSCICRAINRPEHYGTKAMGWVCLSWTVVELSLTVEFLSSGEQTRPPSISSSLTFESPSVSCFHSIKTASLVSASRAAFSGRQEKC